MSSLRRTPLHRALYRPSLVLGAERELVLMTLTVLGGIAFIGVNPVAFAYSALVCPLALYGLRLVAKADPQMSKVYLRHNKYAGYYPARSSAWREG